MKLLECYVSGFGRLREQKILFDEELSLFFQGNGAGKSTLAAFLKAMLYGMPSYKANSKGFEDRRHYAPFGGGAFGGSLTLSFEGKVYCITRRFDAKSEGKDVLEVTCQGAASTALGKVPGRTIFQVDSDSFERTAFFTADPGELGATSGIAGRLQSFLDHTQGSDFDEAYDALENAAKALQSTRGQNGRIAQQELLVRRLEQELLDRAQLSDALESSCAARQALDRQMERSRQRLEENQAAALARERWQRYYGLQRDARALTQKAEALERMCGDPRPTASQRRALEESRGSMIQARTALGLGLFSQEKQSRLEALRRQYPQGLPDPQTLDRAEEIRKALESPQPGPKKPGGLGRLLMLLGLVLALGGGVLGIFRWIAGIGLLVAGLCLGAAGAVAHRKASQACRQAVEAQKAARAALLEEQRDLLDAYGLSRYEPRLRTQGFYLETLAREQAQAQEKERQLRQTLTDAISQARSIFESCGLTLSQDPEADIRQLERNLDGLEPLLLDARRAREAAEDYRREQGLAGEMPELTGDPVALTRELEAQRSRLANLDRQILDMEYRLEDLSETPALLEAAREEAAALRQRYRLVCAARDCLADAQQTLKARHIDPVRSRFDFYADALEQALGARVGLDQNFGLYLRDKGGQYPDRHLSAGQRAAVALCLRLALLDNLYPGDKPPIILDDPFVFLDEAHLEKARALVRSLSQQWQILYFTCHESRKI